MRRTSEDLWIPMTSAGCRARMIVETITLRRCSRPYASPSRASPPAPSVALTRPRSKRLYYGWIGMTGGRSPLTSYKLCEEEDREFCECSPRHPNEKPRLPANDHRCEGGARALRATACLLSAPTTAGGPRGSRDYGSYRGPASDREYLARALCRRGAARRVQRGGSECVSLFRV